MSDKPPSTGRDPWAALGALTPARIALGRAGASLPTRPRLDFQLAHARARTAVHASLDLAGLAARLEPLGLETLTLASAAESRAEYLQRPDRGRRLDDASRAILAGRERPAEAPEVVFVIGDGLSALAITANAAPFLEVMVPALRAAGWRIGPLAIVTQARVAIGDEIGAALGASMVVVLIGERPGLSSPDSLGLYLTAHPRPGLTDEARNCVSNVRAEGLSHAAAAHKLLYLMTEARRRGLSGVALKEEAEALADEAPRRRNFLLDG
ncbi:ethanolamine ammonia-lyase subunit EutC [Amaricoccus solimangrovi]|uniref:Ethanolamine ammonia-lyase small subunit n=1 Tax=Amaricoccus solimangrovi TaxID=2589815 RepID=A0A501WL49_9RHOB|nr:ethanolamine ammonia-lyase subunit EutC [Amaricoccus solimangrovi]TPE50239.1 ethanolamine ammonia-lyase subunit EutC [Amaricoccus solimangrovi]